MSDTITRVYVGYRLEPAENCLDFFEFSAPGNYRDPAKIDEYIDAQRAKVMSGGFVGNPAACRLKGAIIETHYLTKRETPIRVETGDPAVVVKLMKNLAVARHYSERGPLVYGFAPSSLLRVCGFGHQVPLGASLIEELHQYSDGRSMLRNPLGVLLRSQNMSVLTAVHSLGLSDFANALDKTGTTEIEQIAITIPATDQIQYLKQLLDCAGIDA